MKVSIEELFSIFFFSGVAKRRNGSANARHATGIANGEHTTNGLLFQFNRRL